MKLSMALTQFTAERNQAGHILRKSDFFCKIKRIKQNHIKPKKKKKEILELIISSTSERNKHNCQNAALSVL